MDTWYALSLGDGIMAPASYAEIEAMYPASVQRRRSAAHDGGFTCPESEGRLHCEVIAYFSPAAKDVALAFDAEPCEKPARAGLGPLAGDKLSWSILFHEEV